MPSVVDQDLSKRGRAYKCRECGYVGRAADTLWHYSKKHVPLNQVAFHCTLCEYRAKDPKALKRHLSVWKPHAKKATECGVDPNDEQCLVNLKDPKVVQCTEGELGEGGIQILSVEQSHVEWSNRIKKSLTTPEKPKVKARSKKERDLEYAVSILKEQGFQIDVELPTLSRSEPEAKTEAQKEVASKPEINKKVATESEGDEPVISADCSDSLGGTSLSSSSSSSSSDSEDESTSQLLGKGQGTGKNVNVEQPQVQDEVPSPPSKSTLDKPVVVKLDQSEVVKEMADVVQATLKTSFDRIQKLLTGQSDMYSLLTTIGSQMLNTNCNLADVAGALDKSSSRVGETRDEISKLNKQVWELKGEVNRSNNLLSNIIKAIDSQAVVQKTAAAKLETIVESVITSQKILANCIANQTQAFKELKEDKNVNTGHRDERRRVGVSPLRALSGFDEIYNAESSRKRQVDYNTGPKRSRRH